jgi:menaquinone-dependent protoporphyrinogen oxidase
VAKIVFTYSTIDGHTLEICERLLQIVEGEGHEASLQELTANSEIDLAPFDRIVIGASIRYGNHRPEVARFIENNVAMLESRPSAFFSVNAVARKPEKRQPNTNPYVKKFLTKITWKPPLIAIFGGKIDYPRYRFWDKTMIRLIMWMTKGPTDPDSTVDFTDWTEVEAFGKAISAMGQNGL